MTDPTTVSANLFLKCFFPLQGVRGLPKAAIRLPRGGPLFSVVVSYRSREVRSHGRRLVQLRIPGLRARKRRYLATYRAGGQERTWAPIQAIVLSPDDGASKIARQIWHLLRHPRSWRHQENPLARYLVKRPSWAACVSQPDGTKDRGMIIGDPVALGHPVRRCCRRSRTVEKKRYMQRDRRATKWDMCASGR